MRKDCRAEVRCCVDCLRFNVGARGFMPLRVRSVKLLMVEVYGDHVGPFPESGARGYKYILILVDAVLCGWYRWWGCQGRRRRKCWRGCLGR